MSAWLEEQGHWKFTLFEAELNGFNTWYAWKPHGSIALAQPEVAAVSYASKTADRGQSFKLPGLSSAIFLNDPICAESPNLLWYEALHGGSRIPPDSGVTAGIIKIAKMAQAVRDKFQKPLHITSWYRDPDTNWRVGGAIASRHLWGDGIDLYFDGMMGYQVYDALDSTWSGGLGQYASLPYIVHLDARGYVSRW